MMGLETKEKRKKTNMNIVSPFGISSKALVEEKSVPSKRGNMNKILDTSSTPKIPTKFLIREMYFFF